MFELILKMFNVVEVRFLNKAVEFFHFNLGNPFFVHMDIVYFQQREILML